MISKIYYHIQNTIYKWQSLSLAVLSAANIAITFIIQLITFNIIGAGDATDALFLGLAIPTLFLSVTVTALNNVLVPMFSGKDKDDVKRIAKTVTLVICGLGVVITCVLYLSIDLWLPLIANGFNQQKLELARGLTSIQLSVIPLAILYSIQWSILNGQKRHIEAEMSPALVNLFLLPILVVLLYKHGVWVIAAAYPIRILIQNIFLFMFIGKGYIGVSKVSHSDLILVWRKLKPIMLGSIYYKSEPVIDRSLLSNTPSGSLSLFFLAQQIYSALSQIIVKAIVTPNIAKMSECYNKNMADDFNRIYKQSILKIIFVLAITLVLFFLFGENLSGVILNLKSHGYNSTNQLYIIMSMLFGSFVGNVLGSLASSAFYARGNTKTPSYMSMLTYTIYIPVKIYVFLHFGINGLAITISVYSLINRLLLFALYMNKYNPIKVE